MNAECLIKTGRQHFTALTGIVIFLAVVNTIYEVIFGVSYGILFTQIGLTVVLAFLTSVVFRGFRRKNLLFGQTLHSRENLKMVRYIR